MNEDKKELKEAKLKEVATQIGMAIELEDGTTVDSIRLQVIDHNLLMKIVKAVC